MSCYYEQHGWVLENVSGGECGGGGGGIPTFRVMVIPNGKYGTAQPEGEEGDTYIVYYDEGGAEWWTTKDLEFLD